jgi:hypothetical protein
MELNPGWFDMMAKKKVLPPHGIRFPSSLKISEGIASFICYVRTPEIISWLIRTLIVCVHRYYSEFEYQHWQPKWQQRCKTLQGRYSLLTESKVVETQHNKSTVELRSISAPFRPGNWLCWLIYFMVLVSPFRQMPELYHSSDHTDASLHMLKW